MSDSSELISESISAAFCGALSTLSNDVAFVALSSAVQPVLAKMIKVPLDIVVRYKDFWSSREKRRFVSASNSMLKILNDNSSKVGAIKNDLFLDQNQMEHEGLDSAVEAIFQNIISDSETKKSKLYGNFLGNIPYQVGLDSSMILHINRLVRNLTYEQLCVLKWVQSHGKIQGEKLKVNYSSEALAAVLFYELKDLKQTGLLSPVTPFAVGAEVDNVELSVIGKTIYELLDLESVDDDMISRFDKYDVSYTGKVGLM